MKYFTLSGATARMHSLSFVPLGTGPLQVCIGGEVTPAAREIATRVRAALAMMNVRPRARVDLEQPGNDERIVGADLAIALAFALPAGAPDRDAAAIGELTLGGEVRTTRGVVPAAIEARKAGAMLYCAGSRMPHAQFAGCLATPIQAFTPEGITQGPLLLGPPNPPTVREPFDPLPEHLAPVFNRVREAFEKGRNVLLVCPPPVSGATLVARHATSLIPDLTPEQRLDVVSVQSAAGFELRVAIPFRAPHHTVGVAGMRGGPIGYCGEVDLARHGVLLLDEVDEFSRGAIKAALAAPDVRIVAVTRRAKPHAAVAEKLRGFEIVDMSESIEAEA